MNTVIFFAPDIANNPQLPEQESHHCANVLRMKEGDKLTITDGKGSLYDCTLMQAHSKRSIVQIDAQHIVDKSWNFSLHIAFAPTKSNDRTEWFIEKATEIGIDTFTPLQCRFSERKNINLARWNKTAIAAVKQSQKAQLPQINNLQSFDQFITQPFDGQKFIAHCYPTPKESLTKTYQKGKNVLILIGPEGDFSEEEVEKAVANGFQPIELGKERLRTETACFTAAHTIHVINNL